MNLPALAGALAIIGSIATGAFYMDDRHAQSDDLKELAGQFQQQGREIALASYRARLWALQDKFGPSCGPARDECRRLKAEIEKLIRQLRR